jgi:glc operon protein GlcG
LRLKQAIESSDSARALAAGLACAEANGWAVCIAIVDDAGAPIQLTRMDGASPASVDGAIGKARSAAMIGVDTKLLETMIEERPALATMSRVAVEGGVPLFFDGQRVGGIGVSGVQPNQDAEVARAGREALVAHWACA